MSIINRSGHAEERQHHAVGEHFIVPDGPVTWPKDEVKSPSRWTDGPLGYAVIYEDEYPSVVLWVSLDGSTGCVQVCGESAPGDQWSSLQACKEMA